MRSRLAFRSSLLALQMSSMPGLSNPSMGNRAGVASGPGFPVMPSSRPGAGVHIQNAMQLEAERLRQLEETVQKQYYVVREKTDEMRKGRVIGIDLGTTNSCVCYIDKDTKKPKIIPSPTGSWVFPTAVTFDKNHQIRLYAEEARACVRASASSTLCSGKRLIGRGFGELGRVRTEMNRTNILTTTEKGDIAIEIMGRSYTVVHIIAMFLRYLKNEAEKYLKEPVNVAVVSVPAYFTPQQKVATEDAALCAGFDVLEIIDEPSAACLTYTVLNSEQIKQKASQPSAKRILRSFVFDLGGGTLDCAIMEHDQYRQRFRLLATHGDPLLGGNDWDAVISQHFAQEFERKWRIQLEAVEGNVGQEVAAYRNLILEAEKAKVHFTHSSEPYYGYNRAFHFSEQLRDIIPLEATLTHEQYVTLTRPLRVRCFECVGKLFEHTGLRPCDIDSVLLVGAMTRDPPIRHMLQEYFCRPIVTEDTCPPDYAVAIGAAIRGGMLQGTFPEMTANTRFVAGTVQSLQQGGLLRRLWCRIKAWTNQANPNAIGQRWRGKARGLSDAEIEMYAKELVEFEAASERRLLLERSEDEANRVMRRVAADSNRKQGMQEKRIIQLSEQLKFWQYMVHNFHDHEKELLRTVSELQAALDELDGLSTDNMENLTDAGTIDFTKILSKTLRRSEDAAAAAEAEGCDTSEAQIPNDEKPSSDSAAAVIGAGGDIPIKGHISPPETPPPQLVRHTIPLPQASTEAVDLVKAGHMALLHAPDNIKISEPTRISFLENMVEERAWREPPVPPGEKGSWMDVKKALEAGEPVGATVPLQELTRSMTMDEMLERLKEIQPIDDSHSEAHVKARDLALALQTMTIVKGAVCIEEINQAMEEEQRDLERKMQEWKEENKEKKENISAHLFR